MPKYTIKFIFLFKNNNLYPFTKIPKNGPNTIPTNNVAIVINSISDIESLLNGRLWQIKKRYKVYIHLIPLLLYWCA